jgi:hypothetical protein
MSLGAVTPSQRRGTAKTHQAGNALRLALTITCLLLAAILIAGGVFCLARGQRRRLQHVIESASDDDRRRIDASPFLRLGFQMVQWYVRSPNARVFEIVIGVMSLCVACHLVALAAVSWFLF